MKKLILAFALTLLLMAGLRATAQEGWKEIPLAVSGRPLPSLKVLATPAVAECNGQKFTARLLLIGHLGSGKVDSVNLGVVIDDLGKAVPASELELFEGPELAEKVARSNTLAISLTAAGATKTFATRSTLNGIGNGYPAEVRGKESECFETNLRPARKELDAWAEFLRAMSQGFDEGVVVLGGPVLTHAITVRFSDQGLQPLLQAMLQAEKH